MWEFLYNLGILVLGMIIGSIITMVTIYWMWYTGKIEAIQ